MIPLDDALRPTWLFGRTVHEGCDRAGYYEQGDFATEYGSPKCIVKLGCWGPVVKCNVPKRGWMNGDGRLPERRRHLHRLHDAGLPGQVHAFHGRATGRQAVDDGGRACTAPRSAGSERSPPTPSTRNRSGANAVASSRQAPSGRGDADERLPPYDPPPFPIPAKGATQ